MIDLKRVYDRPQPTDGPRLLVERLWPRGMKKETLHMALWLKEAAPSEALRRWFGHDPAKWADLSAPLWQRTGPQPGGLAAHRRGSPARERDAAL